MVGWFSSFSPCLQTHGRTSALLAIDCGNGKAKERARWSNVYPFGVEKAFLATTTTTPTPITTDLLNITAQDIKKVRSLPSGTGTLRASQPGTKAPIIPTARLPSDVQSSNEECKCYKMPLLHRPGVAASAVQRIFLSLPRPGEAKTVRGGIGAICRGT